jgi:hypothetical protein
MFEDGKMVQLAWVLDEIRLAQNERCNMHLKVDKNK